MFQLIFKDGSEQTVERCFGVLGAKQTYYAAQRIPGARIECFERKVLKRIEVDRSLLTDCPVTAGS